MDINKYNTISAYPLNTVFWSNSRNATPPAFCFILESPASAPPSITTIVAPGMEGVVYFPHSLIPVRLLCCTRGGTYPLLCSSGYHNLGSIHLFPQNLCKWKGEARQRGLGRCAVTLGSFGKLFYISYKRRPCQMSSLSHGLMLLRGTQHSRTICGNTVLLWTPAHWVCVCTFAASLPVCLCFTKTFGRQDLWAGEYGIGWGLLGMIRQ